MQQSGGKVARSIRLRGTQPALPGATLPTAPLVTASQQQYQAPAAIKRPRYGRKACLQLLGLGILSGILLLALYPLLANVTERNDLAKQALLGLFPWQPRFYWTTLLSPVAQAIAHLPWFNGLASPATASSGSANLLLCILLIAFLLLLVAARVGRRVAQQRLSRAENASLFWLTFGLAGLFGVLFLFAPPVLTQDMFLYGFSARMVTVYHVNPYVVPLSAFPHDLLAGGLPATAGGTIPYGPIGIDLGIPVALIARESVANVLLAFRLLGLLAHLVNIILLWAILARLKPEHRFSALIFYAWNPLVLLMGIGSMHLEMVVILFVLLGIFLFQRRMPVLGWMFLLLAALINALCLLLLPLFLRLFFKEGRLWQRGQRFLNWFGLVVITALALAVAYLPFWQGAGVAGIGTQIRQVFLQNKALNSLDAAFINLPIAPVVPVAWLTVPHHWTTLAAVVVGVLLLFGLWLGDTLELVVLFGSWLLLSLLILLPTNWPWYSFLPLVLALISASRRTVLLAMLLTLGATLSLYYWLWQPVWAGQGLLTIGLPLLLWGWTLFFTATWQMTHTGEEVQPLVRPARGTSRPTRWPSRAFPSRPSWPGRRR